MVIICYYHPQIGPQNGSLNPNLYAGDALQDWPALHAVVGCVGASVGRLREAKQRVSAETQERSSKSRGMNQQVAIEQTKRR